MIVNIDEFYNNNNYKQFVPLEALQKELQIVGKTFLKDVKIKNVLSITFSIDDYGESPIYIEYLDEKDQKHLVKLKPAIHEELDNVLKQYAKITYVDSEIAKAIQTSKDYTDETKEALTILINGSKEEAIQISKAYTDVEINKLNTDLKQYIDERDEILFHEIVTYADTAVNNALVISKQYTDDEINKVKQEITSGSEETLQQAKDYTDDLRDDLTPQIDANKNRLKIKNATGEETDVEPSGHVTFEVDDAIKAIEVKQNNTDTTPVKRVDFSNFATSSELEPLTTKLSNIWGGHKAAFIYWLPNIDINTMKLENVDNDVKVTLNDGDVVYWRKNPAETLVNITTQMDTSLNKRPQKDLNFLEESNGNARLIFDNDGRKYYVGKDWRVIHTQATNATSVPGDVEDLGTMEFNATRKILKSGTAQSYRLVCDRFKFPDQFNANISDWEFNTAPITGDPLTQPTLRGNVEWHQNFGFASGDYIGTCGSGCEISEWTMRLLNDTCGVLGWSQRIVTGSFTISIEKLRLNYYYPGTDKTYHELTIPFTTSIESWANRSIQVVPAQIKFNFNGSESTFISCFAKIENKTLTLDNFDERKLTTVCKYVNDNNLNGTAGTITIRLNGGY